MEELEGPLILSGLWHLLFPHAETPAWFVPLLSSWLVMIFLLTLGVLTVRRLQLRPGGLQNVVEMALEGIQGLSVQIAGPEGSRFLPLFATLFLFILCSNLMGLLPGCISPTMNVNINAAMAIIVILTTEFIGLRHKGLAGYLKHFCGPSYWLAPLFIIVRTMEVFTRPLSLTMRLFGNMLAKEIILGVLVYLITLFFLSSGVMFKILIIVPFVLRPAIILLGVLVAFIQALVFTALSMSYIGEALEQH